MSASSTPTFRPLAASPSAMLTAVVDLPTPPLPDATAMIEAMPGTPRLPDECEAGAWAPAEPARVGAGRAGAAGVRSARRRPGLNRRLHAAALLLGRQRHHGAGNAGDRLDDALGGGAQRLHLLRARGRHGDREEHLLVGDEDVRDQPEIDDIAGEIRAVHGLQTVEDGFLGDGHGGGFRFGFGFR